MQYLELLPFLPLSTPFLSFPALPFPPLYGFVDVTGGQCDGQTKFDFISCLQKKKGADKHKDILFYYYNGRALRTLPSRLSPSHIICSLHLFCLIYFMAAPFPLYVPLSQQYIPYHGPSL